MIAAGTTEGAALLDEPDTVPDEPSYLNGMYFDEIYHARTSYEFLHTMSVYEWTHPPLGKILIMLGVVLFGMKPFGWRVVPALWRGNAAGVFTLAKRLFRRRDLAFLAAALLALDTMHFTQTRIATVDVFILFFILLMVLFMTDYIQMDYMKEPLKKLFLPLGACGVSFGLGVASKWTGLYAGAGLAAMFFAHMIRAGISCRKDTAARREFWRRTWATVGFCCVFFLAIPALIYYLSYIPFFRYEATKPNGVGSIALVLQQQESMYHYHHDLTATHTCQSAWYEWPFIPLRVVLLPVARRKPRFQHLFNRQPGRVVGLRYRSHSAGRRSIVPSDKERVCTLEAGRIYPAHCDRGKLSAVDARAALHVPVSFLYHVPVCRACRHSFFAAHGREREVSGRVKWIWLSVAAAYFVLMYPAASGLPMPRLYAQFLEYVLPCGQLFFGAV